MFLTRKKPKDPSIGDFCSLNLSAKSKLITNNSRLTQKINAGEIISRGTITNKTTIGIENCEIFHISHQHPLGNELLSITPVIIQSDPYGYGIKKVMEKDTQFIVNKNIITIFTGDVKEMISENINDSIATRVFEYIGK